MKNLLPFQHRVTGAWKIFVAALTAFAMLSVGLVSLPAALADEPAIELPETVSSDFIPTPQLNGVAWDLRVRGDVAYVVGSFTRVRPSGVAAGGAGEVVRNNAMAFNITNGQILSWNPNINAPVLDIEFSPDGNTFYLGGQFSAVSGQARSKVAAFSTNNGALTSFSASVGGSVETLAVTADAVFLGGSFNSINGQSRNNLAKLSRSNAALQGWAPVADDIVHGIVATDFSDRVIVGGRFQTLNGTSKVGIGAVNKDSGDMLTWNSNLLPARINDNERAWVVDLKLEDGVIYAANNGMGWHWFDGRFAATYDTGDMIWLDNCYGSTSSISVMGDILYSTPHAHDCSSVNGFPEENPMIWKRALAETIYPTGTDQSAPSNNSPVSNQPIPTLLHWYPALNTGFYTGQYQGGWAMDNNGDYLVLGGEFTRLNNINQQGLAVFPKRSATNNRRPEYTAELKPSVISQGAGKVRVAWPTTWDYDDEKLTYEVLRDNSLTALDSQEADSIWWKQGSLGFRDETAAVGSTHTYRIRVSDPAGNNYIGPRSEPVTIQDGTAHPLAQVLKDTGAVDHYPLNETSGTVAYDHRGFVDADASSALTLGVQGIFETDSAASFSGQSLATRSTTPAPDTFSTQVWFNTTSTSGGKLIGFGSNKTGDSASYDRHVWMDNSGKLHFGTWQGWAALVSSSQSYNDGQWHQMVATLGAGGMTLSVDGLPVAQRTDVTSGQVYTGNWRIGQDNLNGWPNQPSSTAFNGSLDEIAIFDSQLDAAKILQLFQATGRTADVPEPPADAYGRSVYDDQPSLYWRLDETSGATAQDATLFGNDGNIASAVKLDQDGIAQPGKAFGFGRNNATVVAQTPVNNPNVFSTEAWIKTTTDRGGKIVGFGNAASGLSSSYDRHVYMRDDGTLLFGTYSGVENLATTTKSYNDGQWHHVVATMNAEGMKLYVDGALQATNPQSTGQNYNGFWRIGGDRLWSGASSQWFDGLIDEVAIYPQALSATQVDEHYSLVGAPNEVPTAEFAHTVQGLNVQYDASASTDTDGSITEYLWDFGDGSTQSTATEGITHLYTQAGQYTVKLRVKDDRNGQANVSNDVVVEELPLPPVASIQSEQNGLSVSLSAAESADPDGSITGWEWDFGDGSALQNGETVKHTYTKDGSYTVSLTVTDDQDLQHSTTIQLEVANAAPQAAMEITVAQLQVNVDGSGSTDAEAGELSYAWDFGDGESATGKTAEHTYSEPGDYELKLVVTDEQGASGEVIEQVTVQRANVAPVALFDTTITALDVHFDASASTDVDGQIVEYAWDFGDGTTGAGKSVEHSYATSDAYPISLVVTDDQGATHRVDSVVQVFAAEELEPTAAFTSSADGLKLSVDASTSLPPAAGGPITGYEWDFGDSSSADTVTAQHSYAQPGSYAVTLTVHAGSHSSQITQTVSVGSGQGPNPQFSSSLNGLQLEVDAAATTAGDAPVAQYRWDFGDGATADGAQASHRYAKDGQYVITLTVIDDNALEASTTQSVAVTNDLPVAAFSLLTEALTVKVDAANSADANGELASYAWDFGDGSKDTGVSAEHEYLAGGDYLISLTVSDEDGATGTLSQTVHVTAVSTPKVLASDDFNRSSTNGWGKAVQGGIWDSTSSKSNFSVTDNSAKIRMASPGSGPRIYLPVETQESVVNVVLAQDKNSTGGGLYQYVSVRDVLGVGSYRLKIRTLANGTVAGTFERILNGVTDTLTPETVIGQVAGGAGQQLQIKIQSSGTDQTTLRAKVYNVEAAQPNDWQIIATDSSEALQTPGRFGLGVYLSGSASNAPILGVFDDLLITEVP